MKNRIMAVPTHSNIQSQMAVKFRPPLAVRGLIIILQVSPNPISTTNSSQLPIILTHLPQLPLILAHSHLTCRVTLIDSRQPHHHHLSFKLLEIIRMKISQDTPGLFIYPSPNLDSMAKSRGA